MNAPDPAPEATDVRTVSGDPATSAPSLHWALVGLATDHPRTADVLALLAEIKSRHPEAGQGDRFVVVLESPDSEPVVAVQAIGLSLFTEVVAALRYAGLKDRLEGQDQAAATVHAAFS